MANLEYIESLKRSKCAKCANYKYCSKPCEVHYQGCENYDLYNKEVKHHE